MKLIGLIGSLNWDKNVDYYSIINKRVQERLGKNYSAKSLLYSFDSNELNFMMLQGEWKKLNELISRLAKNLQLAGADFIIICSDMTHQFYNQIQKSVTIPVLHIADIVAEELKANKIKYVSLLGSKTKVEKNYYKDKLFDQDIALVLPNDEERDYIDKIINEQVNVGVLSQSSKVKCLEIINKLENNGSQALILLEPEIGHFIKNTDTTIDLYDPNVIYAKKAADIAIENILLKIK